ncbi:hypothetical protein IGI04_007833 [Brassica rapa subsp. trilocularis]|uniref:Uncharacterized protein n=1 Tax=Brassica rapa subsp. trilocularis TaxID=1813537 RepID=A0ABQ7NKW0_BRACM|nr:hypothetical protein IGI04_007833 [Brassica rapa subsp. trilocularis]
MAKSVATLDSGTTCSSRNYSGHHLAAVYDSSASFRSSFSCTSKNYTRVVAVATHKGIGKMAPISKAPLVLLWLISHDLTVVSLLLQMDPKQPVVLQLLESLKDSYMSNDFKTCQQLTLWIKRQVLDGTDNEQQQLGELSNPPLDMKSVDPSLWEEEDAEDEQDQELDDYNKIPYDAEWIAKTNCVEYPATIDVKEDNKEEDNAKEDEEEDNDSGAEEDEEHVEDDDAKEDDDSDAEKDEDYEVDEEEDDDSGSEEDEEIQQPLR